MPLRVKIGIADFNGMVKVKFIHGQIIPIAVWNCAFLKMKSTILASGHYIMVVLRCLMGKVPKTHNGETMRTLRASEIGSYLYCRRSWWYRLRGYESANQAKMAAGTEIHREHGRKVFFSDVFRIAGLILALVALGLLVSQCTAYILR